MTRICIIPDLRQATGGPATFQANIAAGFATRGVEFTFDLDGGSYDAILLIAGTRDIQGMWRAKRRGIPIIQRLNGMNWIHRLRKTGLRHYLRSERGNWLLSFTRARLANRVVYQSAFTRGWWERVYGPTKVPNRVIHNAVDLSIYTPDDAQRPPKDIYRLLLVEGNLMGGHEIGIQAAVRLAQRLNREHAAMLDRPIELMIVGRVADSMRKYWEQNTEVRINWGGVVPRESIPEIDRSAHLMYPVEINAACPNSVIEALACGTPVLASDTGALAELVGEGGRVVPYGGDPWKVDLPDDVALADAAVEILLNQTHYRAAARSRAEAAFALDMMVDAYLDVLLA